MKLEYYENFFVDRVKDNRESYSFNLTEEEIHMLEICPFITRIEKVNTLGYNSKYRCMVFVDKDELMTLKSNKNTKKNKDMDIEL